VTTSPDIDWASGPLESIQGFCDQSRSLWSDAYKIVSPLFESSDDGEHLGVMDLVISLYRVQHF
jgi:hypothetical protein